MKKDKNIQKKAKCVVTGGAGFIGSHLVDFLISEGMEVIVIDDLSTGRKENINPKAVFIQFDIREIKENSPFFDNADFVFHFAALPRIQPSFEQPIKHEEVNVVGAIKTLLACKNRKIKKFVYASSSACYGTPKELPTSEEAKINCLSPYALQKYTAEQYCLILGERYNIPVIALRFFNVYGPRSFNPENPFNAYSSVIGIFENQKKEGKELTITGDGEQSRDFIHVYDVVKANILAAKSEHKGRVYNIGFGSPYTINQIAQLFESRYRYIPERKGEARITWAKIDKAKKELGWFPSIKVEDYIKNNV